MRFSHISDRAPGIAAGLLWFGILLAAATQGAWAPYLLGPLPLLLAALATHLLVSSEPETPRVRLVLAGVVGLLWYSALGLVTLEALLFPPEPETIYDPIPDLTWVRVRALLAMAGLILSAGVLVLRLTGWSPGSKNGRRIVPWVNSALITWTVAVLLLRCVAGILGA